MKKLILVLSLIGVTAVQAQNSSFGFFYSTGMPLGQTADFVNKFSWLGWGMEGKSFIQNDLSIGGLWAINTFNQTLEDATYVQDNTTYYGTQYRYINSMPFMLTVHKYFGTNDARPYVGTGIGAYKNNAEIQYGTWAVTDYAWMFGLMPELGVESPMRNGASFYFSTRFNYGIRGSGKDPYTHMTFNLGIQFE